MTPNWVFYYLSNRGSMWHIVIWVGARTRIAQFPTTSIPKIILTLPLWCNGGGVALGLKSSGSSLPFFLLLHPAQKNKNMAEGDKQILCYSQPKRPESWLKTEDMVIISSKALFSPPSKLYQYNLVSCKVTMLLTYLTKIVLIKLIMVKQCFRDKTFLYNSSKHWNGFGDREIFFKNSS